MEPSQAARRRGPSPTVDRAADGHRAPPLRLEGHALLRRARATAKKAPGCDGWAGRHWSRFPEQFFHSLAEVWNSILDGASIPAASSASIAALAWRLGAACLVQLLGDWIRRMFPEELYGGLPGRSVDDVHTELTHDLYVQRGGGFLAGCKSGRVLTALPLSWRSTALGRWGLHRLCWT